MHWSGLHQIIPVKDEDRKLIDLFKTLGEDMSFREKVI